MRALLWWYDWGIWIGLVLAIGATFGVLYDSRRKTITATGWQLGSALGVVLMLPSFFLVLFPENAVTHWDLISPFGWLGIAGLVVAVGGGGGYLWWLSTGGGQPPWEDLLPTTSPPQPPSPPQTALPQAVAYSQPDRTRMMGEPHPAAGWLVARSGPRAGRQFGLSVSARSTIGRDGRRCDMVLDDPSASAEHARIQWEHGIFVLYDLASTNGTWVNNQRVQRQSLLDGDVIRIGDTTFVFKSVR